MSETFDPGRGSESRLLGGLRKGDEEAVQKSWHRYFQPLVRLARGRLSGHVLANDLHRFLNEHPLFAPEREP